MSKIFSFFLFLPLVVQGGTAQAAPAAAPETAPETTPEMAPSDQVEVKKQVESKRRILVMDLRRGSGLDDEVVGTITSMLAVTVAQENNNLDVLTGADVREMLKIEADKQGLGCEEGDSCLAELANALGVELVLHGDVGRLGELYIINLHVFNAREARSVARETLQVSVLDEFASKLKVTVRPMLTSALSEGAGGTFGSSESSPDEVNYAPWILTGSGGLLALIGGVVTAVSLAPWIVLTSERDALSQYESSDDPLSQGDLEEIAAHGAAAEESRQSWNTWGNKLFPISIGVAGVGVGVLAGGVLWALQSMPAE